MIRAAGKLVSTPTANTSRLKSSSTLTVHQRIAHKVHRPATVDDGLRLQTDGSPAGQAPFSFAAHVQLQLPINSVDALMVPCISPATQYSKIFGKSVSRVAFGQLKKRRYHKTVVTRRWFVKKHASTYAQCRAHLADGKSMLFVNEQHDVTLLGLASELFFDHILQGPIFQA